MDLETVKERAIPLCFRHDVRRLELFGSVARGASGDRSDVDLLVEFDHPDQDASRRYFGLLFDLEEAFGCPVDLLTAGSLKNSFFRARVLSEKVTIYER